MFGSWEAKAISIPLFLGEPARTCSNRLRSAPAHVAATTTRDLSWPTACAVPVKVVEHSEVYGPTSPAPAGVLPLQVRVTLP